jgi:hypothetical protein
MHAHRNKLMWNKQSAVGLIGTQRIVFSSRLRLKFRKPTASRFLIMYKVLSRNFIWEGTKFTMSSPCIHFIFTFGLENQKFLISMNDAPSQGLCGASLHLWHVQHGSEAPQRTLYIIRNRDAVGLRNFRGMQLVLPILNH